MKEQCAKINPYLTSPDILAHRWPGNTIYYALPKNINLLVQFGAKYSYGWKTSMAPISEMNRPYIESALNSWSKACGNQINFQEEKNPSAFFKGIMLFACDNYNVGGVTLTLSSMSHLIYRSIVCIPPNIHSATKDSNEWNQHVIAHEMGHALGIQKHPHEIPQILALLKNMIGGGFCSVMPYFTELIDDTIKDDSERLKPLICRKDLGCDNSGNRMPIEPGPTDAFMCQTLYDPTFILEKKTALFDESFVLLTIISSFYLSIIRGITEGTLKNIKRREQSFLSEKSIRLLSDASVITTMLYLEFPSQSISLTIASLMPQLLLNDDDSWLNKLINTLPTLTSAFFFIQLIQEFTSNDSPSELLLGFLMLNLLQHSAKNKSAVLGKHLIAPTANKIISTVDSAFFNHQESDSDDEELREPKCRCILM